MLLLLSVTHQGEQFTFHELLEFPGGALNLGGSGGGGGHHGGCGCGRGRLQMMMMMMMIDLSPMIATVRNNWSYLMMMAFGRIVGDGRLLGALRYVHLTLAKDLIQFAYFVQFDWVTHLWHGSKGVGEGGVGAGWEFHTVDTTLNSFSNQRTLTIHISINRFNTVSHTLLVTCSPLTPLDNSRCPLSAIFQAMSSHTIYPFLSLFMSLHSLHFSPNNFLNWFRFFFHQALCFHTFLYDQFLI